MPVFLERWAENAEKEAIAEGEAAAEVYCREVFDRTRTVLESGDPEEKEREAKHLSLVIKGVEKRLWEVPQQNHPAVQTLLASRACTVGARAALETGRFPDTRHISFRRDGTAGR